MTRKKCARIAGEIKEVLGKYEDFLRSLVQGLVQELLEAEMDECLGAGRYERTGERVGYRSGHYSRNLVTRLGTLESRVPQDRDGRFSTQLFSALSAQRKGLGCGDGGDVRAGRFDGQGQSHHRTAPSPNRCVVMASAPGRSVTSTRSWMNSCGLSRSGRWRKPTRT